MRCDRCRFYQERSDYKDRGWCRRHPPHPVTKKFGEFPLVSGSSLCGEFREIDAEGAAPP